MALAVGPTQKCVRRGGIKSKQLSCERGTAGALSATCAALKWGPWKTRPNAERQRQTHTDPLLQDGENMYCASFNLH